MLLVAQLAVGAMVVLESSDLCTMGVIVDTASHAESDRP